MGFIFMILVTSVFSQYASIIGEVSGNRGVGDGNQVGVPGN